MDKRFERNIRSLPDVFNYLETFLSKHNIDADVSFAMQLAVEEIFTNLVKYHKRNPNSIRITLSYKPQAITVTLSDFDVEEFDITRFQPKFEQLPLEKRKPGGLGLHLVRKMTDNIRYEYNRNKRQCTITLVKHLGETHVRNNHRP